jgi:type IV pilus assembly protein PilX
MLIRPFAHLRRQQGVVLVIALIMLLAMTLGGIALIRSVYTSSLIAGNMAFQQAATSSGDAGVEAGITWLESNSSGTTLHANSYTNGYAASRQDPGGTQTWNDFWTVLVNAGQVATISSADAAGNTISYTIQRLCNAVGDPTSGVGCSTAPATIGAPGSSRGASVVQLTFNGQVYYRITSRVSGPRGSVSFVQAVVAM